MFLIILIKDVIEYYTIEIVARNIDFKEIVKAIIKYFKPPIVIEGF